MARLAAEIPKPFSMHDQTAISTVASGNGMVKLRANWKASQPFKRPLM